jgi:hypothetical protein
VIAMTSNNGEKRLGGSAGTGPNVSETIKQAIQNSTRSGHNIGGAAPRYGDQTTITLHQGEVPASDLDVGLDHNPQGRKHSPRPA